MGCAAASAHASMAVVEVTQVVAVSPSRNCPPRVVPLSNLDRKCPSLMYYVFFYKPAREWSLATVFQRLRVGLERTLAAWYPAAGRLHANSHGKLDLLCNDAGAVMAAASTDAKISELGDLSQYSPFLENLVYRPDFEPSFSDMPLMVAQITKFGCGGMSLGLGASHSLFDGVGAMNFLEAWTACTRSGSPSATACPVHDRSGLLATVSENSGSVAPIPAFEHLRELIERAMKAGETKLWECRFNGMSWASKSSAYELKTFSVSRDFIDALKRLAVRSGGPQDCTSFEVLAAHLWKARVKALGLNGDRKVCVQFTVDVRGRVRPPLGRDFSGNAYVITSAACTAGALYAEGLAAAVSRIRQAKAEVTDDYVRRYVGALDAPQMALPSLEELTLISDWRRTPFHAVDFCMGFGRVIAAVPLASPVPQSAYLARGSDGAVHVRLGLLPRHLDAFRAGLGSLAWT